MVKWVLIAALVLSAVYVSSHALTETQNQRAPLPACAASIDACPLDGCSSDNHHDPKLNRLKNITGLEGSLHDRTMEWIKTHPDPKSYQRGEVRDELTGLAEGEKTRVVGYLLRAKLELGGE